MQSKAQSRSLRKYSPTLIHFNHDIGPPDEFSAHVQLRNGRPLREDLDALTDLLVSQHVDRLELDVVRLEDLAGSVGESALGEELRSLHEKEDGVVVYQRLEPLLGRGGQSHLVGVGHVEGRDACVIVGGGGVGGPDGEGGRRGRERRQARQGGENSSEDKNGALHCMPGEREGGGTGLCDWRRATVNV
ncbi:hypothetical protein ACHAWF_006954, partial [Thalassiosira exigua]